MAETKDLVASKLFDCTGWVCVVTGGGSGIGLMAAQAFAANGAKVYIVGRNTEKLAAAVKHHSPNGPGQIIAAESCDVRKKEDLEELIKQISAKEDHVDCLLTAAGVSGAKADPSDEDAEKMKKEIWDNESVQEWAETYETDVTAVYFTAVAFLPLLQKATKKKGHMHGSIITISSMSGMMVHAQSHFSYNAAKGATVQLSKLMSGEFLKLGIRCNSIAPGYFPSEMTAKESGENQKSVLPDEKVQEKGHVPKARPGKDQDMAQAVLFLATCQYLAGQIVAVDGGVMQVIAG